MQRAGTPHHGRNARAGDIENGKVNELLSMKHVDSMPLAPENKADRARLVNRNSQKRQKRATSRKTAPQAGAIEIRNAADKISDRGRKAAGKRVKEIFHRWQDGEGVQGGGNRLRPVSTLL